MPRVPVPVSFIPPLLPTLTDRPPEGADWIHEVKHDGYRTQLVIERGAVRAFTRNGLDWSERYPGIVDRAGSLACRSAILDGEVIIQDERGASDFEGLQLAMRFWPQRLIFYAFDLLHLNGKDLRDRPLLERRAKLKALLNKDPKSALQYSEGSPVTPPPSSRHAPSTSLRASSRNLLALVTGAAARRPGSKPNASPKASSSC
jgi:bifunctional non-homologous end joining protein LigD